MPAVVHLLAAEGRDLPIPPWSIGLLAFGLLCAALLVTLSFGKDR
jgi:hypothetical protein